MRFIRLVFLTLMISAVFASPAFAERAMWVWSMADDIVLDSPAGSRTAFFNFCAAPHGDGTKAITTIYLSGNAAGKDLVVNYASQLRNFLSAAHSRGLKVECLQGDKYWATPDYRANGEARCDAIINFNKGGSANQRFDGIHYDVEPHGLHYDRGDTYDWDADNAVIWPQYLTLLENCQSKVNTYNATYPDIKFGADITWWYDADTHPGTPEDVQSRIDYVAIMDYRERGVSIVEGATGEVGTATALGKKVFIGLETAQAVPPDPETISFYEEGNTFMEQQLTYVSDTFGAEAGFGGFAIHYYEDTSAGEVAYRGLWTTSFPGYQPIVRLAFPNGDEGVDFVPGITYNISWTTIDNDTSPGNLSIDIEYSSDGGGSWNTIATGEANDGIYAWNTTGLSDGTDYRVKVTATDPTPLSGYDRSNHNFTFSSTPSAIPNWTSAQNSGVNGIRPIIIPDGNILHMVWYWPGWGGQPKGVYYKKSVDGGSSWGSTFTLAESATTEPRKPALAVSGNTLAVIWVEGTGANGAKKVKVRTSTNGGDGWNAAEEIQGNYTTHKWADFPDISIDSSGTIHAVWGARSTSGPWRIHYNSKSGVLWGTRYQVATSGYYITTPALTSNANGTHVVWSEFNWGGGWKYIIRYRRKTVGWGTTGTVSQVAVSNDVYTKYFPRICSDSSNKLHVVWQTAGDNPQTDTPPTTSDIYYSSSSNGGISWATSVYLGDGYVPQICADESDIRVIYYRPSSTNEKGDIRYRISVNSGVNWSGEDTLTTDARMPYYNADVSAMVGFPYIAPGSMVATWRGYSNDRTMFSYKGKFDPPSNIFVNLVNGSGSTLKLKWEKPNGYSPNSYSLFRSHSSQAFSEVATDIYNVEYTDTGLTGLRYYKYKVKAVEGAEESGFSNISNVLSPVPVFLIDYFEAYEGIDYSEVEAGTSSLTRQYYTGDKVEGAQSMRLTYTYGGSGWGAVMVGEFPTKMDISGYDIVKFWANGGTAGNKGIAIQFVETGRPEGNEAWTSSLPTISNTIWQSYEFYLSDFTRADGDGNNKFDKQSIGAYQLFFSENTPNGIYLVDRIELQKGQPSLVVSPSSVAFGTISGSQANHRFQTPAINVVYGGFDPPWTVRIWTNNSPGGGAEPQKAGLKGADGTTFVPLKVWCANYGPGEFSPPPGPDEENNYFWEGYDFNGNQSKEDSIISGTYVESNLGFDINGDGDALDTITPSPADPLYEGPVWLRIPEGDEMVPGNRYTWRRFTWNDGQGNDAGLGGDFNSYLGVDTAGVKPQNYNTTTLTVEYINQ